MMGVGWPDSSDKWKAPLVTSISDDTASSKDFAGKQEEAI